MSLISAEDGRRIWGSLHPEGGGDDDWFASNAPAAAAPSAGNAQTDKVNAWRAAIEATGQRADQTDANVTADPRFQAWTPGTALPATIMDGARGGTMSLSNVGNIAPIAPFTGKFAAPNPQDVLKDPAIQFQMEEGAKMISNNASARGVAKTGGTLRRLQEVGQGIAAQGYSDLYNRAASEFDRAYGIFRNNENDRFNSQNTLWGNAFNDRAFQWGQTTDQFNMNRTLGRDQASDLISLSNIGHPGSMAGLGANYANTAGNLITNQANANAAAQATSGAGWGNAVSGMGDTLTSLALLKAFGK